MIRQNITYFCMLLINFSTSFYYNLVNTELSIFCFISIMFTKNVTIPMSMKRTHTK